MKKLIELKENIENSDVISFDIFDTLIKRDVPNPEDLFDFVISDFYSCSFVKDSNFKKLRMDAENKARSEKNKREVTLRDIYENLDGFSQNEKENLMTIECRLEKYFCKSNIDIKPFYDMAIKLNKKVIITSDMYLPIRTIEDILKSNGFDNYYKLYLSCDVQCTKANGDLFEYVKNDLSTENILHIGDNLKSDILNAKKHDIKSFYIKKDNIKLSFSTKKDNKYLSSFINNGLGNDYYYNFGYECLGPLLYSFSKWLKENTSKDKENKLFFLARDGKIMKDAFDIMYPDEDVYYLLASRRSYIIPSLFKHDSVTSFFNDIFTSNYITIPYVINKMGISIGNDIEIPDYLDLEKKYKDVSDILSKHKEGNFLIEAFEVAKKNSQKENELMKQYLYDNGLNENSAIVDIGWFGNMQNALQSIVGLNVKGYYLGVNSDSPYKKSQYMKGFLFNKGDNLKKQYQIRTFIGILELIFSRYDKGSFIKFEENENGIVPIYKDKKYAYGSEPFNNLKKIREGALSFVRDYNDSFLSKYINLDESEGSSRLIHFGLNPRRNDINKFNVIHSKYEDCNEYLFHRSLIHYLFNVKEFDDDFQSSWFSGFIYKLIKFKFPISNLYVKLRNKKSRGKNEKI